MTLYRFLKRGKYPWRQIGSIEINDLRRECDSLRAMLCDKEDRAAFEIWALTNANLYRA